MKTLAYIAFLCLMMSDGNGQFKTAQLNEARVLKAHERLESQINSLLKKVEIDQSETFDLHLRAYKKQGQLEVWVRAKAAKEFKLIKTYPFAGTSGQIGPKRKQGDRQIPEGFYTIDRFNPWSSYHLSLGLDYPNPSDRILGKKGALGGDIFIHGSDVTIGCIPITDTLIEELYLLCVEAKDRGQRKIPVHIFPCRMDESGKQMLSTIDANSSTRHLWSDLEKAYCDFESNRALSKIVFLENGQHQFRP